MNELKEFMIKADATIKATDIDHAMRKLGKYFLSKGNKKEEKDFELILETGEFLIVPTGNTYKG